MKYPATLSKGIKMKMSDDDLISRKAAIEAMEKSEWGYLWECEQVINVVKELPPAEPEQKWIPVSERLPEDEYVLISKLPTKISGSEWCVTIAMRTADPRSRKTQWRDIGFGVIQDDKVLAWMPLPKPYKENKEMIHG